MAVPLVQRGVAVAAVGYDIAPKGRHITNCVMVGSSVESKFVT